MNIYFADDCRFRSVRRRTVFRQLRRPTALITVFAAVIAWLIR